MMARIKHSGRAGLMPARLGMGMLRPPPRSMVPWEMLPWEHVTVFGGSQEWKTWEDLDFSTQQSLNKTSVKTG